jgi:hypothetical protein
MPHLLMTPLSGCREAENPCSKTFHLSLRERSEVTTFSTLAIKSGRIDLLHFRTR